MKKNTIMLLALLTFTAGAWADTKPSFPRHEETGENSESNPYIISSIEDLDALAADVNSGIPYAGKYFKLTAENGLDYSGQKTFTPIGYGDNTDGKPFSGIFDGNGKTISGITVNTPKAWGVGLFGYISKATIKNVTITNSSFTAEGFVGAIAGCSDEVDDSKKPAIENCHVTNSVTVTASNFGTGGIIGIDNDNLTIKDCTCAATVTSSDTESKPGGIIGVAYEDSYMATITDSYYLGNLPAIGENGGQNGHVIINITLLNDDSQATVKNTTRIANYNGETANVTLDSRTLYKDGAWNTLCLPFSITSFTGTPLEGATVKALTSSAFDDEESKLTLNFTEDANNLTETEAGTPYIVKWGSGTDVENPVFSGVTINNTQNTSTSTTDVDFVGSFSPVGLEANNTTLFLSKDNKLYYPSANMTVGSCRAVFQLKGDLAAGDPTAGDPTVEARAFVLNFGEETTGIVEITDPTPGPSPAWEGRSAAWFSLDGRKLSGKPTQKGVYVNNGKKIVIK